MQDGFDFSELSDFRKDLLKQTRELFPKEVQNFVKGEAGKIAQKAKKIAKNQVGASGKAGNKSYHKKFKTGKPYDYDGDKCCRAYNSSPHGHLIENGHYVAKRGKKGQKGGGRTGQFVAGKHIFQQAELQHRAELEKNTEDFLYKFWDDIGK